MATTGRSCTGEQEGLGAVGAFGVWEGGWVWRVKEGWWRARRQGCQGMLVVQVRMVLVLLQGLTPAVPLP